MPSRILFSFYFPDSACDPSLRHSREGGNPSAYRTCALVRGGAPGFPLSRECRQRSATAKSPVRHEATGLFVKNGKGRNSRAYTPVKLQRSGAAAQRRSGAAAQRRSVLACGIDMGLCFGVGCCIALLWWNAATRAHKRQAHAGPAVLAALYGGAIATIASCQSVACVCGLFCFYFARVLCGGDTAQARHLGGFTAHSPAAPGWAESNP